LPRICNKTDEVNSKTGQQWNDNNNPYWIVQTWKFPIIACARMPIMLPGYQYRIMRSLPDYSAGPLSVPDLPYFFRRLTPRNWLMSPPPLPARTRYQVHIDISFSETRLVVRQCNTERHVCVQRFQLSSAILRWAEPPPSSFLGSDTQKKLQQTQSEWPSSVELSLLGDLLWRETFIHLRES
jgi:hypothetical protein